jgi:6-pyruvoyl-tetrahydropterin synthase
MSDGHVYATRKFTFSAAHRYGRPEWSESENRRVFGHLTVSHGHNYVLEVTIRGPVDEETGMVMDLAELKRVVSDAIIQRFDHADLNADPLLHSRHHSDHGKPRARAWDLLLPKLGPERLWRLRLWEDPTFYVEYFGE